MSRSRLTVRGPAVALGLLVAAASAAPGQEKDARPAADRMAAADQQLRATAVAELAAAAKRAGVAIDPKRVVYVSAGEGLLVHAAVAGAERLKAADLEGGAKTQFVYVSLPKGAVLEGGRQPVPAGYYTVRLTVDKPFKNAKAQLIDAAGKVVAEGPARVDPPRAGPVALASLSGGFGRGCIWGDIEFESGTITVTWCRRE